MQEQVYATQTERDEEYLAAQRASMEALHVGRATLSQAQTQAEQLERADQLADETEYKLQRAARVLRGMTWSGWVANLLSSSSSDGKHGPPPPVVAGTSSSSSYKPPDVYEGLPDTCHPTAQHVQNYHANVKVLEACETEEQKETCRLICDDMFQTALKALDDLHQTQPHVEAYALQLARDLDILRRRQVASQQQVRGLVPKKDNNNNREELLGVSPSKSTNTQATSSPVLRETERIHQQQEEHLDHLSLALGELGSIAKTLNQSMTQQNETLEQLDTKSENILEQQHMVNRRTERLIQKKSWTPVKPAFYASVTIRHKATGLYLAVQAGQSGLCLTPTFHAETCVFGLWKRQGSIFGLKNKFSRKWVGQTLLGQLACAASSFGRREEWEASMGEDHWSATKLICASAGWGNGGYLLVRRKDYGLLLGGNSATDREQAAVWCIQELWQGTAAAADKYKIK